MADEVGTKGAELNLLIRQGATLGPYTATILDKVGDPIDITGASFQAEIRKTPDSQGLENVSFTFNILDAVNGVMTWEVDATSTANIPADENGEEEEDSQYVWDWEMHEASGKVTPLTYGVVKVFREVTKG